MHVRDARPDDLLAVNRLYNAWIPTLTITWTDELQTEDRCLEWFQSQQRAGFPVLVADELGEVIGYTAYGHFRGEGRLSGYGQTAELSIHVQREYWGQGIGRTLIESLIERARINGIHVLVAAIDGENEASQRFHDQLGFVEVARMPETGHKFGRWLDLVLMQRIVDPRPRP